MGARRARAATRSAPARRHCPPIPTSPRPVTTWRWRLPLPATSTRRAGPSTRAATARRRSTTSASCTWPVGSTATPSRHSKPSRRCAQACAWQPPASVRVRPPSSEEPTNECDRHCFSVRCVGRVRGNRQPPPRRADDDRRVRPERGSAHAAHAQAAALRGRIQWPRDRAAPRARILGDRSRTRVPEAFASGRGPRRIRHRRAVLPLPHHGRRPPPRAAVPGAEPLRRHRAGAARPVPAVHDAVCRRCRAGSAAAACARRSRTSSSATRCWGRSVPPLLPDIRCSSTVPRATGRR